MKISESSQTHGMKEETELVVEIKRGAVTASQEWGSGKGKEKKTSVADEELPHLEIASDYGMSELDDSNWEELEMSVKRSTHAASIQEAAVMEAVERIEHAYSLFCKVQAIQQEITVLQPPACVRPLGRRYSSPPT